MASVRTTPAERLLSFLPPAEYNDEVNEIYASLPDSLQSEVTKDDVQYIVERGEDFKQTALENLKKGGGAPYFVKDSARVTAKLKLVGLSNETTSPREIDVLLARCLSEETYDTPRSLDPMGYAEHGVMQSYESLNTNALFSTRTLTALDGDSVHFMMFSEGANRIQCQRFSFGDNPLFSAARTQEDPCNIDKEFYESLGIQADSLFVHALRLERIQHVLRTSSLMETEVQALFCHWLACLIEDLDGEDGTMRVRDVVGMNSLCVTVEVCNEYLCASGKAENASGTGISTPLTIKSDVAVCDQSCVGDPNNAFLKSRYHVEMKQARLLKNYAMGCKSQLLAESLAKALTCVQKTPYKLPQVVYSVLCDGLCLHVLIHYPESGGAYLSHREIEPGRMTAIMAWVHSLSARQDLTEDEFLKKGFAIGDTLEEEVKKIVAKKHAKGEKKGSGGGKCQPSGRGSRDSIRGIKRAPLVLDIAGDDERFKQAQINKGLSTFCSVQNHFRYNDPLYLNDTVIRATVGDQPLSMKERLQRAGF